MKASSQAMRAVLLVGTAMLASPAMAQSGAQAPGEVPAGPGTTDAATGGIEDIVVTAQRREESLQEVPVAVTALTGESLRNNRVQTIHELTGLAPGLTVVANGGGQNSASISLRGVTSTAFFPGQSSGISTYIDGVYIGSINATISDLADIARVEVLRGPQGTLFGRNSNGGAISITTSDPAGEFRVRQEFSAGNFDYFRSKTQIDLPRFGPFTATISYLHSERRGDIRNLGGGTQWDWTTATNGVWGLRTSPNYLGNRNTEGVAAKLRIEAGDKLDVVFKFDYTDTDYTDAGNAILGFVDTPSGALTGYSALGQGALSRVPAAIRTPVTNRRPDAANNWFVTPAHQEQIGGAMIATFTASEAVSFKNILAYRHNEVSGNSNLDGLGGVVGAFGNPGPVIFTGAAFYNPEAQWTNETQITLTTQPFDLTAGFFYFDGRAANGPAGIVPGRGGPGYSGNYVFIDSTEPYSLPIAGTYRTSIRTKSKALYAQGAFHLTDQLDLLGGIRYTWDHIRGVDNGSSPALIDIRYNFKSQKATWLAGINFKPTDDVLLYAKVSTGYITGGAVGGITFKSEDATSYEAGLKADIGRTFRANIAVYQADYDGLQVVGFINGTTPAVLNIADARNRGIEAELTWVPVPRLTLSTGFAYSNFEYKKVDPKYLALNGITAGQLLKQRRPELVGNAAIGYETEPMSWGGTLSARFDAIYRGEESLSNFYTGPASQRFLQQRETVMVNGRIAVGGVAIGPVETEVAIWGRNLTDVKAVRGVINASVVYSANYEPARTFGVDLITRF